MESSRAGFAAGEPLGGPALTFTVTNVSAEAYAAVPTLRFDVAIAAQANVRVRSLLLNAQIRIDAARRAYASDEQARLVELFGTPDRWGKTLRSLLWTHATLAVAPFEHETTVKLLVPCTYDFDVAASKYFAGLSDGDVPLELLFSGSVFYDDANGRLQTTRLSWESEARYRMPTRVWRDLIDQYFPNAAWLRLRRETFDRLYAFKAKRGVATWDEAIEALLDSASDEHPAP
ncbi:MAG TPA: DUF6084 family protein [Gemmatimonadaceae bacterium]|jgi:hypothetical protein